MVYPIDGTPVMSFISTDAELLYLGTPIACIEPSSIL